jgi:hypothetical protein
MADVVWMDLAVWWEGGALQWADGELSAKSWAGHGSFYDGNNAGSVDINPSDELARATWSQSANGVAIVGACDDIEPVSGGLRGLLRVGRGHEANVR